MIRFDDKRSHRVQSAGEILAGSHTFSFSPTSPRPPEKFVTCRACDGEFKTAAYWLGYRWFYANTCEPCADKMDGSDRDRQDAPVKTFRCLKCRKPLPVKGLWKNGAWFYENACHHCGTEHSSFDRPIPL